jgi:Tripartite ATP-independent periplasmic transporters, DctQ component.
MKKSLVAAVTLIHILLINFSMIMIVAMLLLVFANVVLRYVFNSGIYWSEEVALVLECGSFFCRLGLGVKHRLHISINVLETRDGA